MLSLSSTDIFVVLGYLALVLGFGIWIGRKSTVETYYANSRSTTLPMMLFSSVATWVGAGAIVGVCSASFSSGISFALSVVLINTIFMSLFAYIAPRLKTYGDTSGAYTPGIILEKFFGSKVRCIFAGVSILTALVWGAVQLLAMGQFTSLLLQLPLWLGVSVSLLVILAYTASGGLRSDIYTDCLQFVVMLVSFVILIPAVVSGGGGVDRLSDLPASHFDPAGFGGWIFLAASLVIGCLYPLVNVWEWQRVFAANSERTARWSYILSIPLCVLFVAAACLVGLYAALRMPDVKPDQAFFAMLDLSLPRGALGLAYACVLSLIMSSVDSIFVAITAVLTSDLLPVVTRSPGGKPQAIGKVRFVNLGAGLSCGVLAICFPSIVNLSLFATYLSLCFAPTMLGMLFGWRMKANTAMWSILSGLAVLVVSWPILGKNSFPLILVTVFLPLVFQKKRGVAVDPPVNQPPH